MKEQTELFPTKRPAKVIFGPSSFNFFTSHPYSPRYNDLVLNFIYVSILKG